MRGMSKDLEGLYNLIEKQIKVIQADISHITNVVEDIHELVDEAYLMKKDSFELLILMRALKDMLEEIL